MSGFSKFASRPLLGAAAWMALAAWSGPAASAQDEIPENVAPQTDLEHAIQADDAPVEPVVEPAEGPTGQEKANIANVLEFYRAAFNDKDFERARFYLGDEYDQHNPTTADGMEGFESSIGALLENAPNSERMAQAAYAEDGFVILHARETGSEGTPDRALADIFRINDDGKIVEHWEVAQEIPTQAANENGMFYDGETPPDPTPATPEQEEANRAAVVEFYDRAFNRKDWAAASALIGPTYIQHDPSAADGPEGLRAAIEGLQAESPESRGEIQASYVDGDRVILHVHTRPAPDERGSAAVDIFRVEDGLIVEHWDIVQAIPEDAENDNGMFYGQ